MKLLLVTFWFLMTCSIAAGQEQGEKPRPPATKLEAFQARTGVVLISGFTTIGIIRGLGGVTVEAREFRDAGNPNLRTTGISIVVSESGRENTSFVDADEIDSLLKGIEYITQIGKDVTKHENFEVNYRTKGGLGITVFNERSGKISVAVASGRVGRTQAFIGMKDLEELHKLIIAAKEKL